MSDLNIQNQNSRATLGKKTRQSLSEQSFFDQIYLDELADVKSQGRATLWENRRREKKDFPNYNHRIHNQAIRW